MFIENTFIPGLKLIRLKEFKDNRGSFIKIFNEKFFAENGLETHFKESYYSISERNVIRGMHFQIPPFEHTKLVYLNQGTIIDVVLDIRRSSPTYGKYFSIELNTENPVLVYIPVGCAHGFRSLKDNTMVTYLQTSGYDSNSDAGIHFDSFTMDWRCKLPIVSTRDLAFPVLSQYISIF